MKRYLMLFFAAVSISGFAQISFKASAPKAVVIGEQFRVNYTLTTSGEHGNNPVLPNVTGLKQLYGPSLSSRGMSSSNINGTMTSQVTEVYTFVLMGEKEGEYTIPAATIKVGNSEYKSNELKVSVLPQDQSTQAANANAKAAQDEAVQESSGGSISGEDLFIRMHVSKSSVYENEGFLVTFKLYTTLNVSGFEAMKFPEFEGFIAQDIELPTNKQMSLENYQGRNYRTVVLKQCILYPQRSGKLSIGTGKYEAVVQQRVQARSRSIFDMFDTYTQVKKPITSAGTTITVKPLPAGKPASFSGAVGDYKMTSSISTKELKTNEPVTIKLTLSGAGNIKLLKNPEIVFPNDFEVYDPKIDVSTKVTTSGVSGTKTIEYYAVPRYAGNFTIPSAQLSYFDLKTGAYKTLSTEEYHLKVEQGAGGGATAPVVTGATKEDIRFVGADIRHIRTDPPQFHQGNFLFGTTTYWLFFLIPTIIFIIVFSVYRKQVAENANLALVRTKKANKVASKRLKTAQKYLKTNQWEAFYDEALKAVWGYLSDKLTIPVANLTKENVETELLRYGADTALIEQFKTILTTAEFARYAPAQAGGTMDELYQSMVNVIDKMENTIKK